MSRTADTSSPLVRAGGWLAFWLFVLVCTVPPEAFSAQQYVAIFRFIDNSWRYGLTDALRHGQLSGDEIIFNYGPLCQALHALGLIVPPGDAASLLRWHDVGEHLLVALGCWWLVRGTGVTPGAGRLFFGLWVAVLAAPGDFRVTCFKPMGGLFPTAWGAGAILASATVAKDRRGKLAFAALLWSLSPALMSAYSFEMGPLTLLTECLAAGGLWLCGIGVAGDAARRLRRDALWTAAVALAATGLIVGLLYATPLGRVYLVENWSLVRSYPKSWAAGGGAAELALLSLPVMVGAAVGIAALRGVRPALATAAAPRGASGEPSLAAWGRLIGAAAFASLLARYALTRTDIYHVWRAVGPSLFVAGVLAPCLLWRWSDAAQELRDNAAEPKPDADRRWAAIAALGLALAVTLPWTLTQTFKVGWQIRALQLGRMSLAAPHVEITDDVIREAVAAARRLPQPDLAVWPYGALVNVLSGKRNPVPTVHFIEAHNDVLAEHVLRNLSAAPEAPVMLYTAAIEPDGMANITRTPRVVRRLLENYQLQGPVRPGFALLEPRSAPLAWQERDVAIAAGSSFVPGNGQAMALTLPPGQVRASDLFTLRLRIAATPLWGFRKPGRLVAVMVLSDGAQLARALPAPFDGQPFDALISAMELHDPLWFSAFQAERGRLVTRQYVQEIRLTWAPLDVLSARPAEIEALELRVLEPSQEAAQSIEIDLQQRWQSGVWRRTFGQAPALLPSASVPSGK